MNEKIAIINHYDLLASIGIYSLALSEALGERATLYSLSPRKSKSDKNVLEYPGIQFEGFFPEKMGLHAFNQIIPSFSYQELKKKIKSIKMDGGITHYSSSLMLPIEPSENNVVSIHDIIFIKETGKDAPFLQRKYFEFALRKYVKYDYIITPTEVVKSELIDYGVNGDITAIPYGTAPLFYPIENRVEIKKKLSLPLDKKLILSISTNVARKNLATVEKVMESLGPDFRLVRVGSQVGNSITFPSAFGNKLNEIYNACDLLLFPTLDEGLGYPLIEAFATSLPVVTSNIPVCIEICKNSARYVEPMNPHSVIEGIKDVINNIGEYQSMISKMAPLYSMERFSKRINSFYSNIK